MKSVFAIASAAMISTNCAIAYMSQDHHRSIKTDFSTLLSVPDAYVNRMSTNLHLLARGDHQPKIIENVLVSDRADSSLMRAFGNINNENGKQPNPTYYAKSAAAALYVTLTAPGELAGVAIAAYDQYSNN